MDVCVHIVWPEASVYRCNEYEYVLNQVRVQQIETCIVNVYVT